MRRRKGFTLVEMLIVVAVVAILVAIAIPVFSAQLERVRKATCDANLTSCVHLLYAAEMTSDGVLTTEAGGTMDRTLKTGMDADRVGVGNYKKNQGKPLCPDGGAYMFEYDQEKHTVSGNCTIHGSSFGNAKVINEIKDAFDAVGGKNFDSGAASLTNTKSERVVAALKAAGIDMNSLGAKSWRYYHNGSTQEFFYWSMEDISGLPRGNSNVLTIRYNFTSGTYTVWNAPIEEGSTDLAPGETYNALGSDNIGSITATSFTEALYKNKPEQQTFENALAYYLRNYQNPNCLNNLDKPKVTTYCN